MKKEKIDVFPLHSLQKRKCAFTLAEVLITLGIIGVIAAITIPVLVESYREKALETGLERFYSVMNQAFYHSRLDNGDEEYWEDFGDNSCAYFKKYLLPYLKNIEYECGYYNKVADFKNPSKVDDERFVGIYFASGDMAVFSYGKYFTYTNKKKYYKVYPEFMSSSPNDSSDLYGSELFVFKIAKNCASNAKVGGIVPLNDSFMYSDKQLLEICKLHSRQCSTIIVRNGWKIPDNYPYRIK